MLKPDASEGALPEQGRQARNPRTNAWDNAIESLDGPSCGSESGAQLECFRKKWEPVFRTEARQNNELGSVHDSIKAGQTLVTHLAKLWPFEGPHSLTAL
jgi:hypothetical protein